MQYRRPRGSRGASPSALIGIVLVGTLGATYTRADKAEPAKEPAGKSQEAKKSGEEVASAKDEFAPLYAELTKLSGKLVEFSRTATPTDLDEATNLIGQMQGARQKIEQIRDTLPPEIKAKYVESGIDADLDHLALAATKLRVSRVDGLLEVATTAAQIQVRTADLERRAKEAERWPRSLSGEAWGLLATLCWILVLAILFWKDIPSKLITSLGGAVHSFKIAGLEVELSSETVNKIKSTYAEMRDQVNSKLELMSRSEGLKDKLEKSMSAIVLEISKATKQASFPPYRATAYVPDALVSDQLLQLTDYVGTMKVDKSKKQRFRVFTIRYGIIGKTWRYGSALIEPQGNLTRKQLIQDWGMTAEEAAATADSLGPNNCRYYACAPIRDSRANIVGLIYFDCISTSSPFDAASGAGGQAVDEAMLETIVGTAVQAQKLDVSLSNIYDGFIVKTSRIDLDGKE